MRRRDFVKSTLLALPGLATVPSFADSYKVNPRSSPVQEGLRSSSYPTFDQYQKDPMKLGQNYLDGLVRREFYPDECSMVTKIIYDHTGALCKVHLNDDWNKNYRGSEMKLVDWLLANPEASEYIDSILVKEIDGMTPQEKEAFLKKPESKLLIAERVKAGKIEDTCTGKFGLSNPDDVLERSSTVIIFGSAGKEDSYSIGDIETGKKVEYPASELKMRAILRHEFSHAYDNYYGVNIGGKPVNIFSLNISHSGAHAIHEARAWTTTYKFLKSYNRRFGKPSQRYSPEYITLCTRNGEILVELGRAFHNTTKVEERALLSDYSNRFYPIWWESQKVIEELSEEFGIV